MSSQSNAGIPLSHRPSGVGYRLLELPPELVSLLESEDPPTLKLESSPTAGLLKTPGRTYSLRQKNTSNDLMLLSVADAAPARPGEEGVADGGRAPVPGLAAIATVHETIELVPEAAEAAAAPAVAARGKWHERFGRAR